MVGEPIAPLRPLRADAARNRARILDAARTAFAEAGLDVGVEEIARRAGVGKGTLYRRFPTKEALVRAIFDDILDEVERITDEVEQESSPQAAFAHYLSAAARMQADNQGFYDVVAQRLRAAAPPPGPPPSRRSSAAASWAPRSAPCNARRRRASSAPTSSPRTCS